MQSEEVDDLSPYDYKIAEKEHQIVSKKRKISSMVSDWEGNVDRVTEFNTSPISYSARLYQELHDLKQERHDIIQLKLHNENKEHMHDFGEVSRMSGKITNQHNSAFIFYYRMLPTTVGLFGAFLLFPFFAHPTLRCCPF